MCPKQRPAHAFYLQPLKCPRKDLVLYNGGGFNELSKVVGRLCNDGGLFGYYTNHSLRATAASRLYARRVDEQLIMERTGHSSVAGVRSYKRTTSEQKENVSDLMCSKKQKVDCEAEKDNRETNPATVAIQARICASPGVMPHIAAANTGRKSRWIYV